MTREDFEDADFDHAKFTTHLEEGRFAVVATGGRPMELREILTHVDKWARKVLLTDRDGLLPTMFLHWPCPAHPHYHVGMAVGMLPHEEETDIKTFFSEIGVDRLIFVAPGEWEDRDADSSGVRSGVIFDGVDSDGVHILGFCSVNEVGGKVEIGEMEMDERAQMSEDSAFNIDDLLPKVMRTIN